MVENALNPHDSMALLLCKNTVKTRPAYKHSFSWKVSSPRKLRDEEKGKELLSVFPECHTLHACGVMHSWKIEIDEMGD